MNLLPDLTIRTLHRLTGILLLLICVDITAAGNPVIGKEKAALCIGCHVPGAPNPDPLIPKLAGQLADYIVLELLEYKTGRRQDPVMSAIVMTLTSTEDLLDVAAYYAALPQMSGSGQITALTKRGEKLFIYERCTYCHGDTGRPNTPFLEGAPIIGGQNKEYLNKTLLDIRAGKRKVDQFGLMEKVLSRQSDENIAAMAEYISTLQTVSAK